MEGEFIFAYSSFRGYDPSKVIQQIHEKRRGLRVCSLSKTYKSHLLWAHYASGFTGMAIEVEIDPNAHPELHPVWYIREKCVIENEPELSLLGSAKDALTYKYRPWQYEQEVRIIQSSEWFELHRPIRRVIAGHRMHPSLFETLDLLCRNQGVELTRTSIPDVRIELSTRPNHPETDQNSNSA